MDCKECGKPVNLGVQYDGHMWHHNCAPAHVNDLFHFLDTPAPVCLECGGRMYKSVQAGERWCCRCAPHDLGP